MRWNRAFGMAAASSWPRVHGYWRSPTPAISRATVIGPAPGQPEERMGDEAVGDPAGEAIDLSHPGGRGEQGGSERRLDRISRCQQREREGEADSSNPRHTRSARPARPGRRIAQQTADCDDCPAVRLPPGNERLERLVDIRVEGRAVEMGDDDRAAGAAALHGGDLALRRPAERVAEEAVRADRALP